MTKEELKALGLTDEQVAKVTEDYGKNYVSKSQFNEKNEALKNAEKEKGELTKQIEGLKKNNDSNADLKKQIEAMQAAAKTMETEHATQLAQIKLDAAVEHSLTVAKAKNTKAARALLDLKDAKLDEKGEVIGLSDKIKELQKSDAYLFESDEGQKKEVGGIHPGAGSDDNGTAAKLTVQQQFEQALGI